MVLYIESTRKILDCVSEIYHLLCRDVFRKLLHLFQNNNHFLSQLPVDSSRQWRAAPEWPHQHILSWRQPCSWVMVPNTSASNPPHTYHSAPTSVQPSDPSSVQPLPYVTKCTFCAGGPANQLLPLTEWNWPITELPTNLARWLITSNLLLI